MIVGVVEQFFVNRLLALDVLAGTVTIEVVHNENLLKGAAAMLAVDRLYVCLMVILALVLTAGMVPGETFDQEKKIDELVEGLGQRDWRNAVDALAEIGEPAVEPLIRTLKDKSIKTWVTQARAANVLAKIGTQEAIQAIVESLRDTEMNQYVRGFAAIALGETKSVEMVEALIQALTDENQFVRWKCAQALGILGHRKCVGSLVLALKDEDHYVRAAAVRALGQTKSKEAVDDLIGTFGDKHWLVRFNARNVLVEIGTPATEHLVEALDSRDPDVRWQAACVLGRIKSERALARLVKVLGDSDRRVRDEAAVALVRIGSEKAVGLLVAASQHEVGYVKEGAAWVLAEMKSGAFAGEIENRDNRSANAPPAQISYGQKSYPCYPETLDSMPDIPSPYTTTNGVDTVTAYTKNGKYALIPVTVENGEPLNYKEKQWGKGQQLEVDAADFPALARTGLHSEVELNRTKIITGRSVVEITELGRPGRSSGAGFMASNEDIISVLKGDNRLMAELELTHPQMARPLFHVWNMILTDYKLGRLARFWDHIEYISYNGTKVFLKGEGSRGWQESLFDDEILGMFQFEVWRELSRREKALLDEEYPHLTEDQMAELVKKLTHIHTGEMVPYYIMRYGFYEGHTDYRADPIAIAFIFGIRSLEQIEAAFEGKLYEALIRHHVRKSAVTGER